MVMYELGGVPSDFLFFFLSFTLNPQMGMEVSFLNL